ncbi:hypothetical protein BDQ17DRAFT_1329460 [Cyathus striatus]|nr:hypothetical protein BDQ17DRAFT_1329460 [Cyathus striatus]
MNDTWEAAQRELIVHDIPLLQTLDIFQYINFAAIANFSARLKECGHFHGKFGMCLCSIKKWAAWPIVISMSVVELLLMIRVVAIYHFVSIDLNSKKIARFLIIAFSWVPGGSEFRGCLYGSPHNIFYITWIAPLLFECLNEGLYSVLFICAHELTGSTNYSEFIHHHVLPAISNLFYTVLPLLPIAAGSCIGVYSFLYKAHTKLL